MDRRDYFNEHGQLAPGDSKVDESRMAIVFSLMDDDGDEKQYELPVVWEVCGTCGGNGRHVNPSIDAEHGITREELDEDPDFEHDYFGGVYDVTCSECKGKRVVPEIDRERCARSEKLTAILERWDDWCADEADYRSVCDMERRMGA